MATKLDSADLPGATLSNGHDSAQQEESVSGLSRAGLPPEGALIGVTLAQRYRVERLLGSGAMGVVYAVRHVRTGGTFAAKVLTRTWTSDPDIYERFRSEAQIVTQLRHPNIVQVTDFDEDQGIPFMIMELLEGQTLDARLQEAGRLPLSQALDWARQVGDALQAAHAIGVVHRDLKPENIFLARQQPKRAGAVDSAQRSGAPSFNSAQRSGAPSFEEVPKVVDFGISKIRQTALKQTQDRTILGTPHYMSPEAAQGEVREIDGRADQWALGVILYQALSGRLPFDGINGMVVLYHVIQTQPVPLHTLAPELPQHVVRAIERAMSKAKDERFGTMSEFVDALLYPGEEKTKVIGREAPLLPAPGSGPSGLLLAPASATMMLPPVGPSAGMLSAVPPPRGLLRRAMAHRLLAGGLAAAVGVALVVALAAGHRGAKQGDRPAPGTVQQAPAGPGAAPQGAVKDAPSDPVRPERSGSEVGQGERGIQGKPPPAEAKARDQGGGRSPRHRGGEAQSGGRTRQATGQHRGPKDRPRTNVLGDLQGKY